MPVDRTLAMHLIEPPYPVEDAVETLASEQSRGALVQVPGETEALRDRFRARVKRYPTSRKASRKAASVYQRAPVDIPFRQVYRAFHSSLWWDRSWTGTGLIWANLVCS